jgi:hypothetical protein
MLINISEKNRVNLYSFKPSVLVVLFPNFTFAIYCTCKFQRVSRRLRLAKGIATGE